MRSNEEREFERKLIQKTLKGQENELNEIQKKLGPKDRLIAENEIKSKIRRKSNKLYLEHLEKKSKAKKNIDKYGVSWLNEGDNYKGYIEDELIFEIKCGASIYNLYLKNGKRMKYKGCATELDRVMKKAGKLK